MEIHKNKKKNAIRLTAIILITFGIVVGTLYFFTHNKSYKNEAIEKGDYLYLNGILYKPCNLKDVDYTISNVLICKTDINGKIYEIEEFKDYEYVALYHVWDGTIYKRVAEK